MVVLGHGTLAFKHLNGDSLLVVEFAKFMVVLGHGTLAFKHLNGDSLLVVGGCGEDLGLLCRNDGVPGDQFGHDSTDGLDTEGQGVDVEQDNLASILFSREYSGLNSGSIGDGLVGVNASAGLLAIEELLDEMLDL